MQGVREILTNMDGVKGVTVDFAGQLATCTVVPGKFDEKKAIAALDVKYGPISVQAKK